MLSWISARARCEFGATGYESCETVLVEYSTRYHHDTVSTPPVRFFRSPWLFSAAVWTCVPQQHMMRFDRHQISYKDYKSSSCALANSSLDICNQLTVRRIFAGSSPRLRSHEWSRTRSGSETFCAQYDQVNPLFSIDGISHVDHTNRQS
jgi:hypothetical protein